MRKLLNKPWVVGLLASIAVALVAYEGLGLSARAASVQPAMPAEDVLVADPAAPAAENASQNLAAVEMFVASGSRDPFAARPISVSATEKPAESAAMETLKLNAIWLQGADSFVAINGEVFRAGDAIAGASIESVTREGAWLQLPAGRQFLPVGREVTYAAPQKRGSSPMIVVARER